MNKSYKEVHKECEVCSTSLVLRNERDIERKRFCSASCRGKFSSMIRKSKSYTCVTCGDSFQSKVIAKFCVPNGCRAEQQINRSYKMMDNNPEMYFRHALYKKGREELTVDYMVELLARQDGKCALSGVDITFIKKTDGKKIHTNASIDQIEAGKGYTRDNVQIVCAVVNVMKTTLTNEELLEWCRNIISTQGG